MSVQQFSGYDGKASSRVLAPPGGASSGIFSFGAAEPSKPRNVNACQVDRNKSSVFGGEPEAPAARGGRQQQQQPQQQAPIQQQQQAPIQQQQQQQPIQQQQQGGRYQAPKPQQDVTGVTGATGKSQPAVHTSSRVLAPPGGASSGIFG